MENYETLTDTGKGTWDKPYQVKLVTFTRKYFSYKKDKTREIIEYCIRFCNRRKKCSDVRIFSTQEERASFLEKNFTKIKLTPVNTPQPVLVKYPLDDLTGKELSAITFDSNYLQLDFNGHRFNVYYQPLIYNGRKVFDRRDFRYHKELCNFIGKKVSSIDEYLDLGLVIEFEDGCLINMPLTVDETHITPEIVEYQGANNTWILWQVGDPPFEKNS